MKRAIDKQAAIKSKNVTLRSNLSAIFCLFDMTNLILLHMNGIELVGVCSS